MLDFTSALYLGIHHPSRSLKPWNRLTLGIPAALAEPPGASRVARNLAALQGCEQAVFMPSTLHLFWDLFGMLAKQSVTIYLDEGAYAIAHWGAERVATDGLPVRRFRHHDPAALMKGIKAQATQRKRPVVVADGFCPACGQPVPIGDYLDIVRRFGGLLVLDDTQSLGILGAAPSSSAPYGDGGGGVLRWSRQSGPDILVGASLAKGFGVPVAALSGSRDWISRFVGASDTRVHCSPPSVAVIRAAEHALAVNDECGDLLRRRLLQRVRQFRDDLERTGRSAAGGWFPVQTLRGMAGTEAAEAHRRLQRLGVKSVLTQPRNYGGARLSFLITTRHSGQEIRRGIEALNAASKRAKALQQAIGEAPGFHA